MATENSLARSKLRAGALAMFDALGFKGIWRRFDADMVLDKLQRLRSWAIDDLDRAFGGTVAMAAVDRKNAAAGARIELLSDTVVIGIQHKQADELDPPRNNPDPSHEHGRQEWTIRQTAAFTSRFLQKAIEDEPRLTYRGCITFGNYLLKENFLVGEAVDIAAQLMDSSDGAIVWLTPDALKIMEPPEFPNVELHEYPLVRYNVPLKGGSKYRTLAVSPIRFGQLHEDWNRFRRTILSTFVGGIEVQIKRQNTEAFLDQCHADTVARSK